MSTKKTRTTYIAIPDSVEYEEQTFATKAAAVRYGEKTGVPFIVRTSGGAVVHDSVPEETQEAETPEPTPVSGKGKKTRQKDGKEDSKDEKAEEPKHEERVYFRDHGPKHFYKAMTEPVLQVWDASRVSNFTVVLRLADPAEAGPARERLTTAWDDAMAALKEFKQNTEAYRRLSTKTERGRKLRYEMEQEFLIGFVKQALS